MRAIVLLALFIMNSSTFVHASEKDTTSQHVQTSHVFSSNFIDQIQNLHISPMNNLGKAVQAALLGLEIKNLKVFDHEFNVKPAYISKLGN